MAKLKQYAVDVEYTVTKTIYVQARRPGGAEQHALTNEAWREAQSDTCDGCGQGIWAGSLPKDARVIRVREV